MGIFSWLRPRKSADKPKQPHSLVRTVRSENPKLEAVERQALADVAEIEKEDKHFGGQA